MAKILILLLVLTNLAASTAGSHLVDFCQDVSGCGATEGNSQVIPVSELIASHHQESGQQSPSNVPHDCNCPSHHHNCSHNPLLGGRNGIAIDGPLLLELTFNSEQTSAIPSPLLDGPFQPPRA